MSHDIPSFPRILNTSVLTQEPECVNSEPPIAEHHLRAEDTPLRAPGSVRLSPAFMVLMAVLPFWLLPLAHWISNPETATGFFHYEMPYYMANGRAAFDRGNGFLYPNPFDPDPAAPSIYGHWLLWGMGLLPAFADANPGDLILGMTFLASVGLSLMTWKLVAERLPPAASPHYWFLLSMWGGGLLVAGGFLAGCLGHSDPISTLLQFDPGKGLWFLTWGRNSIFATESVYHILVAACWISEMRGQPVRGTVFCGLLAATHPWSGLELLLTLNLWRCLQFCQIREHSTAVLAMVSASMLALFLWYYKIWLPGFIHHERLQQVWELDWSLSWTSAALAYGLVIIPAAIRIARANGTLVAPTVATVDEGNTVHLNSTRFHSAVSGPLTRPEQFLICALLTAVGLVFHDRFMKPVQPLHFTRGYIWMPLFLLGLPVLYSWWHSPAHNRRGADNAARRRRWLPALMLLFTVDNIAFSVIHSQWLFAGRFGFHLDMHERALLREAGQRFPDQVWLTESETLNYLSPAYADIRPWVGHQFNTPEFASRQQIAQQIFSGERINVQAIPEEVQVIAFRRFRETQSIKSSGEWVAFESHNAEWCLWCRVLSPPDSAKTAVFSEQMDDDGLN